MNDLNGTIKQHYFKSSMWKIILVIVLLMEETRITRGDRVLCCECARWNIESVLSSRLRNKTRDACGR